MDDKIFDQIHEVDLKKTIVYRLCYECDSFEGFAGCQGRIKACAAQGAVFYDRAEQRPRQAAP